MLTFLNIETKSQRWSQHFTSIYFVNKNMFEIQKYIEYFQFGARTEGFILS